MAMVWAIDAGPPNYGILAAGGFLAAALQCRIRLLNVNLTMRHGYDKMR